MKKTYTAHCHDLGASITVEIDHAILTDDKLHEINNFWISAAVKLADRSGNVTHAVLDRVLRKVMWIQIVEDWTLEALIRQFDYELRDWSGDTEGFPKMDGTEGIRIIQVEDPDFDDYGIEIEEVPPAD